VSFEPGKLFGQLPDIFTKTQSMITIMISDGHQELEYDFNTFMSKSYPITDRFIRFGSLRMKVSNITMTVGYKCRILDLSELESVDVD